MRASLLLLLYTGWERNFLGLCTETKKSELDKRTTRKAAVEKTETKAPFVSTARPQNFVGPPPPSVFEKSANLPQKVTNLRFVEADILVSRLEFTMDVFLMIRRHKMTLFLDAKENTTVSELKKMIEGITKKPPAEQRLYNKDDVVCFID